MGIVIRAAMLQDCETCAQLSRIEEHEVPGGNHIPADFFAANVDEDKMFIVAENNGEVMGYVLGQPMKSGYAYLSLLAVDARMRGRGLGRMLVDAFLKRCIEKKLFFVSLFAPSFNEETLAFYRTIGFTQGREHFEFGIQLQEILT
ncbi:MAG: GNAT family N-acetyltransferase [Candidatus Thorarchaeota archaeon]|nr:GNAT family N-acetyltransferase [Candidatus Thorarchaeota archaeon]